MMRIAMQLDVLAPEAEAFCQRVNAHKHLLTRVFSSRDGHYYALGFGCIGDEHRHVVCHDGTTEGEAEATDLARSLFAEM